MEITKEWLEQQDACEDGILWFKNQKETDGLEIVKGFVEAEEHLDWANWLIVRIMDYTQCTSYAIFAAEQVLPIFENKYPNDKRVRDCIQGTKDFINGKITKEDLLKLRRAAAYAAAAADAAYADAAYAADAAVAAAAYAADAYAATAAHAADARKKVRIKILNYGISLLQRKN